MTETSRAVESGSQEENTAVRRARGSFERMTWGGIVMDKDFVIFSRSAGSLKSESVHGVPLECNQSYPFPVFPPVVAS